VAMRIIRIGFVVACLLAWCDLAAAQKSAETEAKAQFDVGVELFEKGQFEKASIAFARAYELRPSFKILYLVGKCAQELGRFTESLDAFTRYLSEGGDQIDAARRLEVKKEIERLNALVGAVAVESGAEGATVFIDGRRVGDTPLAAPVFVDLGEHEVLLRRGAVELHREVVKVAGGQRVVVKAAIGGEGQGARAGEAAKDDGAAAKGPGGDEAAKPKPKRVWTWVAAGVGGAAAVGAVVTGVLSLSKTKDIQDDCEDNQCPASLKDEGNKARALAYASDALIAVAGVGVAAGVVLFFLEPKWKERGDAVEVAPVAAPTANGGAFALVGRF
jgi:hypothetical protein